MLRKGSVRIAALLFGLVIRTDGAMQDTLTAVSVLREIGVENAWVAQVEPVGPGRSKTEKSFRALFELEGILWSYAPETGTTLLGRTPDNPARHLDAIEVMLRAKEGDDVAIRISRGAAQADGSGGASQKTLTNACVIGSVAALADMMVRDGVPQEAGLVLFNFQPRSRTSAVLMEVNHCILVYRQEERWYCVDPLKPQAAVGLERVAVGETLDPMMLAASLQTARRVQRAIYLPMSRATLLELNSPLARIRLGHPSSFSSLGTRWRLA